MTREEAIARLQDTIDGMKKSVDFAKLRGLPTPNLRKDVETYAMALDALRMQEKKEQQPQPQQPLTMAELRKMNGETVYCLELNTMVRVSARKTGWITIHYPLPGEYDCCKALGLTLYRTQPEDTK